MDSARLREILGRLCDLEPSARSALLEEVSAGDPHLRTQIEQLLGTYDSALKFLEQFPDLLPAATPDAVPPRTFSDGEIAFVTI